MRSSSEVLCLLAMEPGCPRRVRRAARYRELLERLAADRAAAPADAEEALAEDRADVFGVLANAESVGASLLADALAGAVRPDGKVVPPLVVSAGELAFPFDEIERLRATVSACAAAAPTSADALLKASLDVAKEVLAAPLAAGSSVDGATARLRDALVQARGRPSGEAIDPLVDRTLVERRAFQTRLVLGGPHVRAMLTTGAPAETVPAYIPAELAEALPAFHRFAARVLGEVHARVDATESHPCALRVIAVARVVALPARR